MFRKSPIFSKKLLEGRIKQFKDSMVVSQDWVFLDRGLPDITAYMDMVNQTFPSFFEEANRTYVYEKVFWFPVWKDIYKQDSERYEDYNLAQRIEKYLLKWYSYYNYNLIEVPKVSVSERVEFIISTL